MYSLNFSRVAIKKITPFLIFSNPATPPWLVGIKYFLKVIKTNEQILYHLKYNL
jgi:hypothetical protein